MRLAWIARVLLVFTLAVLFASAPAFAAPAQAAVGATAVAPADVPWWVLVGIAAGSLVLSAGIGRDRRTVVRRSSTSPAARRTPQRLRRYPSPHALEPSRSDAWTERPLPTRLRPLRGGPPVRRRAPVAVMSLAEPRNPTRHSA